VGLWVISLLCFLYVGFLYAVASNPSVRALGFGTIADVQQMSALFFILLFFAALAVEHYAPEAPARAGPAAPPAGRGPQRAASRAVGAQVSLKDPHARPGAPPPMSIPRVFPDPLEGGWQRWKFPSERTGGIYIDTDVVVDDVSPDAGGEEGRGLHILRVRDEVARVCVRCDLIDHCHSKVKTLITKRDMMANFECVSGLRRIAQEKIAQRDAKRESPAAPPAEAAATPVAAEVPSTAVPVASEAAAQGETGGSAPKE
jgi:hypothetical protein